MATDLGNLPRIDRGSPEYLADSNSVLRALQSAGPLARSAEGVEILRYDSARRALLQDREFAPGLAQILSAFGQVPEHIDIFLRDGLLPAMDGEKHTRIRRVLMKVFTARQVERERELIRNTAAGLLSEIIERGQADFVADFTTKYPVQVVSRVIGVPHEDIPMFQEWTLMIGRIADHPIGSTHPQVDTALAAMADYLRTLINSRRARPADDFVTALLDVQKVEGRLTENEMLYGLANLLMAGQDTTRLQLASAVMLLGRHRDQWRQLIADPTLAPGCVDEAMRLEPSVRRVYRVPRATVNVEGYELTAGTQLAVNVQAANRDPRVFTDPDRFDIRRSNSGQQLTFALGPHFCLGAALSRAEQAEALQLLARVKPDFELTEDFELRSSAHNFGGPERLGIAFPGIREQPNRPGPELKESEGLALRRMR
jgi:cytochrome P450